MQRNSRNISLDLYRVLCMFLITTIHIVAYLNLNNMIPQDHFNYYMVIVLQVLQKLSVNGFILITGYFLATTKSTTPKIISFWLQLIFMSVILLLLSVVFAPSNFSVSLLIKSVFPVFSNHYWYPVNYIILLFFVPFLNNVISVFSKRQFLSFIALLVSVVSVFFHTNPFFDPAVFIGHYSHGLIWFFTLYLIGAYVRLYGVKVSKITLWCIFLISGTILFFNMAIEKNTISGLATQFPTIINSVLQRMNLTQNNSIFALLLSVSSFIMFEKMKINPTKKVAPMASFLASTVFNIYLIQEHNGIRQSIWEFANIQQWAGSNWLLVIMFVVFICLWIISILLHLLYRLMCKLCINKIEIVLLQRVEQIKSFLEKTYRNSKIAQ